jgi:hypothetical protein
MAQSSVLRAKPSQSRPRERRPGRLSSGKSRAPPDWLGPHLARLDAGLNGVNGSLWKSLNAAGSSTMLDRGLWRRTSSSI